jgi:molecular chaperone GrpE (heat shock protein)
MTQMRDGLELIYHTLLEAADRESSREKVFDTLYTELREYKNDFIYEHLKPVVRPLLFLYDSLAQFDGEVTSMLLPPEAERRQLSPSLVRENLNYFMDQLVEALRVCEVTQMETPTGAFNPKLHKAVEVQEVDAEEDNTVVRVVRTGWYLNGQLLRPAEVVVGKAK